MANIILRPGWQGREQDVTDHSTYRSRRSFIKQMGLGSIGLATVNPLACSSTKANAETIAALAPDGPLDTIPSNAPREGYPAPRNAAFSVPERPLTDRIPASSYTNFYEFKNNSADLKNVWPVTGAYEPYPMTLEVGGLVEKEFTIDLEQLIREMQLEERIYRFRCVEAWSMTVPWTGFTLKKLIERCKPLSTATHVKFLSINRPSQMPGIRSSASFYPWPYYEGLRMDEAVNELAFVVIGMFGEPLPKQNGSPWRLALPWKYGYKGPKAVQRIEFVDEEPGTYWHDLQPREYSFLSNVNPNVPHPRWSQASERHLTTSVERASRIPTLMYNGYEEWVGDMYPEEPRG